MPWAPDYVTAIEFKDRLAITGAADDAKIGRMITAASRAVDSTTYRQFGQVAAPEARFYTARWDDQMAAWVVVIDDLMDPAGLTATIAAGTLTPTALKPANAAVRGRPYTRLAIDPTSLVLPKGTPDEVTVTAKWGWTAVPDTVKEATLVQTARFFKRKDAPFGIAGSPDTGSELRLLAKVDPDVAVMLKPYTRWQRVRRTVG